jgi:protein-disulfide isomerase
MAGGLSVDGYPSESPGVRPMLGGSLNTPVVRGLTAEGGFFLGDPNAPIHFLEYLDFACPHCVAYDNTAIKPFIEQAVSAGQASYEVRLMQFVAGELSANAAYAMLCAGEQGAAWELREALFAAYDVQQAQAYTTENIAQTAYSLALDPNVLSECMQSARYALHMANFAQSFNDLGLTGTPSMLVSYGSGREWTKLEDRGLENLLKLVAAAQR